MKIILINILALALGLLLGELIVNNIELIEENLRLIGSISGIIFLIGFGIRFVLGGNY